MGFLKFLLAVGLVIIGILLLGGVGLSFIQSSMKSSLFGMPMNTVSFWITGIVGFVVFLGGIYMLRKK